MYCRVYANYLQSVCASCSRPKAERENVAKTTQRRKEGRARAEGAGTSGRRAQSPKNARSESTAEPSYLSLFSSLLLTHLRPVPRAPGIPQARGAGRLTRPRPLPVSCQLALELARNRLGRRRGQIHAASEKCP